jgi:hypothetical protein
MHIEFISLGSGCAIPQITREIGLRKQSLFITKKYFNLKLNYSLTYIDEKKSNCS